MENLKITDDSVVPFVKAAHKKSEIIRTENDALTFSTSGDAMVDFFFHVMEQSDEDNTIELLRKSWSSNALNTLKLVANLRNIRRGKSIRYQSIICLYWLYQNHPLTLYNNLENFVQVGYWKDLLHVLMTILFDGFVGLHLKFDDAPDAKHFKKSLNRRMKLNQTREQVYNKLVVEYFGLKFGSLNRKGMKELRLKYARQKIETDLKYRAFHLKIAQLFASQLLADTEESKKDAPKLSLAAKWAPSPTKHFDRYSLISTTIAVELVKKRESEMDKEILTKYPAVAACLARKIYRKDYLVPLREACCIPEIHMNWEEWYQVEYNRVASKCMKKNKELFLKYDEDRFKEFISQSEKVSGATLKPVDLISELRSLKQKYYTNDLALKKEIIEKQWISLSEDIQKRGGGLLDSALSICDVSGSMTGSGDGASPIDAALGLTLLTAQLSRPPWSSVCVTFSSEPHFHKIDPNHSLFEKIQKMKKMDWGLNTDIDAVFELILSTAKKHKLGSDGLPKILFVFTDMEFDQALYKGKTNFKVAKLRFASSGFLLPTVVFWNLRSSGRNSTPIRKHETGSILVSGYSGKLLSLIMKCKDISELSPSNFVKRVVEDNEYNNFKVFD